MEHPRELGVNFSEFLTSMQLLSGNTQKEMAQGLECSQPTYSRWTKGALPSTNFQQTIAEVFELSHGELESLRQGSLLEMLGFVENEVSSTARLIGAFALRAEKGPPLNEVEVDLIKFLVEKDHLEDL